MDNLYYLLLTEADDYLTTDTPAYIDLEPLESLPAAVPAVSPLRQAYSGFHCFIRQAIDNLKAGSVVYKNPVTGTTF